MKDSCDTKPSQCCIALDYLGLESLFISLRELETLTRLTLSNTLNVKERRRTPLQAPHSVTYEYF